MIRMKKTQIPVSLFDLKSTENMAADEHWEDKEKDVSSANKSPIFEVDGVDEKGPCRRLKEGEKSSGASGGALLIWDPMFFNKGDDFKGAYFNGVIGKWRGWRTMWLLSIYGPQLGHQKEALWDDLYNLMVALAYNTIWILFGDLNVVRFREERLGLIFNDHEASIFNDFVAKAGLHDFQMGGAAQPSWRPEAKL
ncbi:cytochrome P450 [Tanacetum coccineum]